MYGYGRNDKTALRELRIAEPKGIFHNILLSCPHRREEGATTLFKNALIETLNEKKVDVQTEASCSAFDAALRKIGYGADGQGRNIAAAYECLSRAKTILKYLETKNNALALELHASKALFPDSGIDFDGHWQRVGGTNFIIGSFSNTLKEAASLLYLNDLLGPKYGDMARKLGFESIDKIYEAINLFKCNALIATEKALVLELPSKGKCLMPMLKNGAQFDFGGLRYSFDESVAAVVSLITAP